MEAILLFEFYHLLGLQAQGDATREVFPQGDSRVYIELSGGNGGSSSILFKQPAIVNNMFVSPTNWSGF
jgi:hypothetical protein